MRALLLIIALSFILPLAACGKKPGFVDTPAVDATGNRLSYDEINGPDGKPDTSGAKDGIKPVKRKDTFPNTYPKPWL